jgi:DNA polymerase-3 subunit gamma/tau
LRDECHKLSNDAQNALLKALEDTPKHVYLILATTNPEKLLKTIKTRCSTYATEEIGPRAMAKLLEGVAEEEGADIPEDVIKQIANDSLGSARAGLVILDQIIDMDKADMLEAAARKAEEESEVIELCRALLAGASWSKISGILKGIQTQEEERVRRAVLGYCNAALLGKDNPRAADIIDGFADNFFDSGKAGLTLACYEVVSK